jgi:hypothetical protein
LSAAINYFFNQIGEKPKKITFNGNFALTALLIFTAITHSYLHIPVNRYATLDPQEPALLLPYMDK